MGSRVQFDSTEQKVLFNASTQKVQVTRSGLMILAADPSGGRTYQLREITTACGLFRYLSPKYWNYVRDLAISSTDSIYVVYYYDNYYCVKKHYSNGALAWTYTSTFDRFGSGPKKIAIDSQGYIYIIGWGDTSHISIRKIRDDGDSYTVMWSKGSANGISDFINSIWIDSSDNIFLAHEREGDSPDRYGLTKINSSGSVVWISSSAETNDGHRMNYDVCSATGGDVFTIDYYGYLCKFNSSGVFQAINKTDLDNPGELKPDYSGNIICTDRFYAFGGPEYTKVFKFNTSLTVIDSYSYLTVEGSTAGGRLVVTPGNKIYFTSIKPTQWWNYVVVKLDKNLDHLCTYAMAGDDIIYSIAEY